MQYAEKVNINVRIPKELDERYEAEARARMVSKGVIVREILFAHDKREREGKRRGRQLASAA
jgi:predicted DNA-binding protein